jgi:pSer/pThr/pTyr-binding forkhead associated (FHA) protein
MKLSLITERPWNGLDEIRIESYPSVLGRDRDCDCSLPLAFVSRRHCRFVLEGDQVLVHDLESFNGTYVNGSRISGPTAMADGDELGLGPLCFRIRLRKEVEETVVENGGQASTKKIPVLV